MKLAREYLLIGRVAAGLMAVSLFGGLLVFAVDARAGTRPLNSQGVVLLAGFAVLGLAGVAGFIPSLRRCFQDSGARYLLGAILAAAVVVLVSPIPAPNWINFGAMVVTLISGLTLAPARPKFPIESEIGRLLPGKIVIASVVGLTLLGIWPWLVSGMPLISENYGWQMKFAIGPFAPWRDDMSMYWLSHYGFGIPRFANPNLLYLNPLSYIGVVLPEPWAGQISFSLGLGLGIWGGYRLFSLIQPDPRIALAVGAVFVFAGNMYIVCVIAFLVWQIPGTVWTLYFLLHGYRRNNYGIVAAAGVVHALHLIAAPLYLWFFLSLAIAVGFLIRLAVDWFRSGVDAVFAKTIRLGVLFFVVSGALIAPLALPLLEAGPHHVHLDIDPDQYRYSGSLHKPELYFLPFLFPGVFSPGRQLSGFTYQSFLGAVPVFLIIVWVRLNGLRGALFLLTGLWVVVQIAASRPPFDTVIRAIPGFRDIRYTSEWLFLWNLIVLGCASRALYSLGRNVSWTTVAKLAAGFLGFLLLMVFSLAALVFVVDPIAPELNPLRLAGQNLMRPDSDLMQLDRVDWSEAWRPIVVGTMILVATVAAARHYVAGSVAVGFILLIAVADVMSWSLKIGSKNFGRVDPAEVAAGYNLLTEPPKKGIFAAGLGRGRVMVFGKKSDCNPFDVTLAREETVLPLTGLPTGRAFDAAKALGWIREDGCFTNLAAFVSTPSIALARAVNVRWYISDVALDPGLATRHQFRRLALPTIEGKAVYEDQLAQPRAVFYPSVRSVDDYRILLADVVGGRVDLGLTAAIEGPVAPVDAGPSDSTSFAITSYAPTEVVIDGIADKAGFLVLSDLDYPGWRAYVDGKPVSHWPANIVGRAVELESGPHRVEFRFQPTLFYIGMVISLLVVVLLLGGGILKFAGRSRQPGNSYPR